MWRVCWATVFFFVTGAGANSRGSNLVDEKRHVDGEHQQHEHSTNIQTNKLNYGPRRSLHVFQNIVGNNPLKADGSTCCESEENNIGTLGCPPSNC